MNICIGTAQIGNKYGVTNVKKFDLKTLNRFLNLALKDKNDYIDTANGYNSERILGKYKKLNKFKIISKISLHGLKINEKNIEFKVNQVLNNLNQKKIYGLLVHDSFMFKKKELKCIFDILSKYNKVFFEKIGISIYDPKEYLRFKNINEINIIQFPLSVLDQRFIKLLDEMKKNKIETHARSIFLQGKLIDDILSRNADLKKIHNYIQNNNLNKIDFNINFIKNIKNIDKIVLGFNSIDQYVEVVKSFKKNFRKLHNYNINYTTFKSKNKRLIDPRQW